MKEQKFINAESKRDEELDRMRRKIVLAAPAASLAFAAPSIILPRSAHAEQLYGMPDPDLMHQRQTTVIENFFETGDTYTVCRFQLFSDANNGRTIHRMRTFLGSYESINAIREAPEPVPVVNAAIVNVDENETVVAAGDGLSQAAISGAEHAADVEHSLAVRSAAEMGIPTLGASNISEANAHWGLQYRTYTFGARYYLVVNWWNYHQRVWHRATLYIGGDAGRAAREAFIAAVERRRTALQNVFGTASIGSTATYIAWGASTGGKAAAAVASGGYYAAALALFAAYKAYQACVELWNANDQIVRLMEDMESGVSPPF